MRFWDSSAIVPLCVAEPRSANARSLLEEDPIGHGVVGRAHVSRLGQEKIPGARLAVIKDAGHASNLDQPEAFTRLLLDFLGSLP